MTSAVSVSAVDRIARPQRRPVQVDALARAGANHEHVLALAEQIPAGMRTEVCFVERRSVEMNFSDVRSLNLIDENLVIGRPCPASALPADHGTGLTFVAVNALLPSNFGFCGGPSGHR